MFCACYNCALYYLQYVKVLSLTAATECALLRVHLMGLCAVRGEKHMQLHENVIELRFEVDRAIVRERES